MTIYIWMSPLTTAACIIGAALTSAYGFCIKEDLCSYSTKEKFNFGMAILLFVLETFSFLTCLFSLILIGKYATIFVVMCAKSGNDAIAVRSGAMDVVSIHNAADEFPVNKLEDKTVQDVDFEKIRHIRAVSRQGGRSHTMTIRVEEENSGFHLFTPRRNIDR